MTEEQQEPVEQVEEVEAPDMISKAQEAAERLEAANAKMEANIKRMEQARVRETLGGVANVAVEEKEETPEDYAKKVLKGDLNG